MSDFTFKQIDKNEYETFMEGKSLNIFFKIPDGNRIEDLTIRKIDDEYDDEEYENIKGEPTKAAYFEFTKIEKDNNLVVISPLAGLNFLSKEYIKIGNFLHLGNNSKTTIDFKVGASPYFDDLSIENNKRLSLIFTKSDFERIEKDELMKKTGLIPSNSSAINGNSNLTITLGDKTIIDRLIFCRSSNNPDLENKVDLSKIKYLLCNRSCFYPKTNDFTIAVECDAFKFSQATLGTEGRSRQKNGTVCLLKNKYKEKGELNSIVLESNDLLLDNNSSLIVDTKSLTFKTSPKNRNTICEKTNKLSAKDQITLMGARLGNSQITSDNGFITVIDGDLHDATVHFSNTGDESSNGVIKNADIRYSDLKEVNGILTNDLFNCRANNVTFEKESYIKYGSLTRDVKGRWLELENVVLKEQASLYLYDYSNQESPLKKFSNSTIEGKVEIDNDVNYTIKSSVLKSGNMKIKAGDKIDKVLIDNSILEGDNVLYNVSELTCSEVRDSELDLKEPAKISNQLLSFEDIEVSLPVEFKNTDFNQYNAFEIGGALSVENSFFKGLRLISNHDDKETTQKIDNSIFKSIVRLHNISKVSFSEINNTDISNSKEVEISNEFIKDQRIGDYDEFAKSRQARDSFDKDTSITEDLEVL